MMVYIIYFQWDDEAQVWTASNDDIPIALESESLDYLMERVRLAIPEMLELNHLQKPKHLFFYVNKEEVLA